MTDIIYNSFYTIDVVLEFYIAQFPGLWDV